jgi:hypothetical protein
LRQPPHFYFSDEEHKREEDRSTAERILALRDWTGKFRVDEFDVPLTSEHVTRVCRTEGLPCLGLDFTIGTEDYPATLTVRVTFLERKRD